MLRWRSRGTPRSFRRCAAGGAGHARARRPAGTGDVPRTSDSSARAFGPRARVVLQRQPDRPHLKVGTRRLLGASDSRRRLPRCEPPPAAAPGAPLVGASSVFATSRCVRFHAAAAARHMRVAVCIAAACRTFGRPARPAPIFPPRPPDFLASQLRWRSTPRPVGSRRRWWHHVPPVELDLVTRWTLYFFGIARRRRRRRIPASPSSRPSSSGMGVGLLIPGLVSLSFTYALVEPTASSRTIRAHGRNRGRRRGSTGKRLGLDHVAGRDRRVRGRRRGEAAAWTARARRR